MMYFTYNGPFFPPPWDIKEYPEKTEGWIAFQRAMKEDPKYYMQDLDFELPKQCNLSDKEDCEACQ